MTDPVPCLVVEHDGKVHRTLVFEALMNMPSGQIGILLADMARHIATAKASVDEAPMGEHLAEIVGLFKAEMDKPTSILQSGKVDD